MEFPKTFEILAMLLDTKDDEYLSTVAKKTDTTYSHVVKLVKVIEKKKLLTTKRHGRLVLIELTPLGRETAKKIKEIKKVM